MGRTSSAAADRRGIPELSRRYNAGVGVDIHGSADGGACKLVEETAYSDGKKHRVWRFTKFAKGRYVGQRAHLVRLEKVEAEGDKIEIADVPTKDGETHDLNSPENFILHSPTGLLAGCICRSCSFQSETRV